MAYTLSWQIEKRVIYLKLYDSISADDLMSCNQSTARYVAEGTQPVHIIYDLLDVKSFPINLRWVIPMVKGNPAKAEGYRIVVDNDPVIHTLMMAILSTLNVQIHACGCIEEASRFLQETEQGYALAAD